VKITKKALKKLIKEELQHLSEDWREGYHGGIKQLEDKKEAGTITPAEHSELKELRSRPELNENEDEDEDLYFPWGHKMRAVADPKLIMDPAFIDLVLDLASAQGILPPGSDFGDMAPREVVKALIHAYKERKGK